MIHVLTPQEMRAADAEAVAAVGVDALMREAGERVAEWIRLHFPPRSRIVAFAGPGNNGGDAAAAFATLGTEYDTVLVRDLPATDDEAASILNGCDLAVDAIYGTGARSPIPKSVVPAVRALNRDRQPTLAIDVPTEGVRASATLALAALKPQLLIEPGRDDAGELWIGEIGIANETLGRHARTYSTIDDDLFLAALPKRAANGDKRSSGAPLIIAGSEQFPGAAVLCARAAARAGAGYVTVATPARAAATLRTHLVEQVVVTIGDDLVDIASRNSSVAIGPGLPLDDETGERLRDFVARVQLPMVLDASALFHFSKHLELLRHKKCVITPHEGEFARISGKGTIKPGEREARLREFVERTEITTLLKGSDTMVYDGRLGVHINLVSSNALATAGTGDVLTGIIGTLLSQRLSPFAAARMGAYWHGRAGVHCAATRHIGVVAGDLPEALAASLPTKARASRLRRVS